MNQFLINLKKKWKIKNNEPISNKVFKNFGGQSNFPISIIFFFYHFLNICDEIKIGPFALK